ncbi:SDR family NAD(P)-dependent oxidoreductase [Chitinophaga oryziterrae]|uniref:SDR family NAD(P)-dependent oxidoreductase n=1 Tax=Chitinophaga oryziterrae TaxID=1031224 RepID=A0A6N8J467_9BACT|nr:SDR family NAD(P)-dependent oxidoreductase [Chitinophaga oryziterrae]MVT38999.1 SDR family NAD(P)-dependent oxidoreductase [Chitinophaga oryziterrae]
MNNKQVWYVTGASKGLGLALVKKLLSEGYRVAATSRNIASLTRAVGTEENFLPLEVDLGNDASVAASMKATHEKFGSIDVVVNNAGYGIGGAVEELSRKEVADSFDVNVFATITVMQKAMPYLRAQRSGHIMNIASIAGIAGAVGWAVYAAAKNAVIALSDVMAQDVKALGIKVTAVAPGAFRTQFLSQESLALSENKIDDYQDIRASHARYLEMDGKQMGDPVKAAEALIKVSLMPEPPVLLFLGSDAYMRASAKLNAMVGQLEQWKDISDSTQLQE